MTTSDFKRLFRYEFWANQTLVEALTDENRRATQLFSHILASERLWLDRLKANPQTMPVWPTLAVEECSALLVVLETEWSMYLNSLTDERLSDSYDYVNTSGDAWSSTVADTLTHLLTHSCYHRGQIAQSMRIEGQDPPYTDFIQATRQHLI